MSEHTANPAAADAMITPLLSSAANIQSSPLVGVTEQSAITVAQYVDLHGLLKLAVTTLAPMARALDNRTQYKSLCGVEISDPIKGYVLRSEGYRSDSILLIAFVKKGNTGVPEPIINGAFPFVPGVFRVLAGCAEFAIADSRGGDAIAPPPFMAKVLLTPGTTVELVNPRARVMLRPHTDLALEVIAPGKDFGALLTGKAMSIRKFDHAARILRSR